MTSEELEKTGVLKIILDKDLDNEDTTIGEIIEEFEEKLEYIDIEEDKKNDYIDLIKRIKEETNSNEKEKLFNEFVNILKEK